MREPVKVACVQAEPVILDRDATIEKLAETTAEAAREGARLVVFPETFVPAYPSSRGSPAVSRSRSSAAPRWPTSCTHRRATSARPGDAASSNREPVARS